MGVIVGDMVGYGKICSLNGGIGQDKLSIWWSMAGYLRIWWDMAGYAQAMVGYGRMSPASGGTCRDTLGLSPDLTGYLRCRRHLASYPLAIVGHLYTNPRTRDVNLHRLTCLCAKANTTYSTRSI